MKFSMFSEVVARLWSNPMHQRRDPEIKIVVHVPGCAGPTPSVPVVGIMAGFDWDAGQMMIEPAQPLTTLTAEQMADITASVRKGQSWHAFETYKKHRAEVDALKAQRDELLAVLDGADKAITAALPYLPADDEAVFCGEWLAQIREAIANAKGGTTCSG